MKLRISHTISVLSIFLLLTGCSETPVNTGSSNTESTQENRSVTSLESQNPNNELSKSTPQFSKMIGIGDSFQSYVDNYGTNFGDTQFGVFKDGYLTPMFVSGRASVLTINFEATETKRVKAEEAWKVIADYIPKDSKRVTDFKDNGITGYNYNSATLAKGLAEYYAERKKASQDLGLEDNEKPGDFCVYLKFDSDGVFSVNVNIGNYK